MRSIQLFMSFLEKLLGSSFPMISLSMHMILKKVKLSLTLLSLNMKKILSNQAQNYDGIKS